MRQYTIQRFRGGLALVFIDGGGKRRRHQLEARTRKEAEAEARDLVMKWSNRRTGMTVAEIWEAYKVDRKGRPIVEGMEFSGRSVLPVFGGLRPDQITVNDCRAYIEERRAAGRSDGTIWTQMNRLRICLSWAEKRGLITKAPYIERPPKPAPRTRYLTREEIDRLLAVESAFHIRLAILTMLTTAARVAAVLELTWDRVDFTRRQIDLRTGKGGQKGRAVVPINDSLYEALRRAQEAALTDHVIEWACKPVGSIKKAFARTARNAGLDDVSPHVLRHTAAVHMAEAGVSMDEIAQYLGHTDSRITASVYARYSPQHLRKAANALEFARRER